MNSRSATTAPRREGALAWLQERPLDVLVIGGGIVGAGVARDAAMRGLRTGLIEQHDFASGTSSRSSRLLHGGLRYLAQGRLGLVHEASVEKRILHEIAPHLARPQAFLFPTYRGTDWPLWQLRIGVKIYDLLCGGKNFGPSRGLGRAEVLALVPGLKRSQLTGAVRYFDGVTNDARLVLDTLSSAVRHGATAVNYFRFLGARREGGAWRCEAEDHWTGRGHVLLARTVVNATGPWADGLPHSRVKLRLTKGIHVVVDKHRLPVPEAVVLTEGRRILFVIPWGERLILGTTDTDYHGALDAVGAEPDDIAYVLRIVNEFFPQAALTEHDLISTWAGLRPLIAHPNGSPSDLSRSHQIRQPEPGWWDVAGGKLTTYRLMGEQTVDRIVKSLNESNQLPRTVARCRTAAEPLRPEAETAGVSGLLPPPVSRAAVEHCVTAEWALHLDDVMLRRTGWSFYHPDADRIAAQVAEWMAGLLGWTPAEQAQETTRYQRAAGWRPRATSATPVAAAAHDDPQAASVV